MPILATTRQKVIVLLAAGFAVLLANALFSLWVGSRTANFAALTVESQQLKAALTGLLRAVQDAETGNRGYIITHEESYLGPYQSAVKDVPRLFQELNRLSADHPSLREDLPELRTLVNQRMEILSEGVQKVQSGDPEGAVQVIRSGRGKAAMDSVRATSSALIARQDRRIAEDLTNMHKAQAWGYFGSLATLFLILALAAATAVTVKRFIDDLGSTQAELQSVNTGLEKIVEERTGEILRANEEIQRFAYIVSHGLRAPLVNIMGFTSELEAIGKMVDQQYQALAVTGASMPHFETSGTVKQDLAEAIGFIRASTAKMDRLINAILGLSREGRRVLSPMDVDMTKLVTNIAASLKHQISEAHGHIVVGTLPPLVTDRLAIEQVFSNLIENAVKYVDDQRAPRIEITGQIEGKIVEYAISDNGRGIDLKDQERIFELFRRAGRQDRPGEGLGLAFVRAAVRRLGGTIALESEPQKGSTFTLRFPTTLQLSRSTEDG